FSGFFFSSRRRHTRSYGDWSSDVCSSDLLRRRSSERRSTFEKIGCCFKFRTNWLSRIRAASESSGADNSAIKPGLAGEELVPRRSEERRVGKECRSGWAAG